MGQVFNFGSLVDAINPGETLQRTYSAPTKQAIDEFAPTVSKFAGLNEQDIADTRDAARGAAGVLKGLEPDSINRSGLLVNKYLNYNPVNTYERLREGNIASLGDLSRILGDTGRRQSSMDAARLGYGGRNNAYQDVLRQSRVNAAIAPVASGMYSNLGRDTGMMSSAELAALGQVIPSLQARNNLVGRDVPYYALPIQMRDQTAANTIANLLGLAQAAKLNTAGFEYQPSKGAAIASALDTAGNGMVDAVLAYYTGGMAGGGSSDTGRGVFDKFGQSGGGGGGGGQVPIGSVQKGFVGF